MSIWKPATIEDQPEVVLTHWNVRELPNGDRHFSGYEPEYQQGRTSSKIIEFDVKQMKGKTRSGRVYFLKGPPGAHPDGEYVWNRWLRINQETDWKVVEMPYVEI